MTEKATESQLRTLKNQIWAAMIMAVVAFTVGIVFGAIAVEVSSGFLAGCIFTLGCCSFIMGLYMIRDYNDWK